MHVNHLHREIFHAECREFKPLCDKVDIYQVVVDPVQHAQTFGLFSAFQRFPLQLLIILVTTAVSVTVKHLPCCPKLDLF